MPLRRERHGCLDESLEVSKPNLGAVLGTSSTTPRSREWRVEADLLGRGHSGRGAGLSTSTPMHYLRSPWACSRSPCWILWPLMKSQWTGSMMTTGRRPTSWAWLKGSGVDCTIKYVRRTGGLRCYRASWTGPRTRDSSPFGAAFAYHSPTWSWRPSSRPMKGGASSNCIGPSPCRDESGTRGSTRMLMKCASTANLTRWHDSEGVLVERRHELPPRPSRGDLRADHIASTARPTPQPTNYVLRLLGPARGGAGLRSA